MRVNFNFNHGIGAVQDKQLTGVVGLSSRTWEQCRSRSHSEWEQDGRGSHFYWEWDRIGFLFYCGFVLGRNGINMMQCQRSAVIVLKDLTYSRWAVGERIWAGTCAPPNTLYTRQHESVESSLPVSSCGMTQNLTLADA